MLNGKSIHNCLWSQSHIILSKEDRCFLYVTYILCRDAPKSSSWVIISIIHCLGSQREGLKEIEADASWDNWDTV